MTNHEALIEADDRQLALQALVRRLMEPEDFAADDLADDEWTGDARTLQTG